METCAPLILFILKKFHDYDHHHHYHSISNGLKNSCIFVVDLLLSEGYRAKLVEAIDGNSIDALVAQNRPHRVVLEAVWVTPAKIAELQRLHPTVKWTVRVHSEIPFLANEGMAVGWLAEYLKLGVEVSFNSKQTSEDVSPVLGPCTWLPNYYPLRKPRQHRPDYHDRINIGCFGAIRPLKNQLIQAFAAIRYAKEKGKKLFFHMNGTRQEQGGNNNLKNLISLFTATGHELVLHPWMNHDEFLELIAQMDACMQVSLSESFCIVASDAVSMGVPLVGSEAIDWLPRMSLADPSSAESICDALERSGKITVWLNHEALTNYLHTAAKQWNHWTRG